MFLLGRELVKKSCAWEERMLMGFPVQEKENKELVQKNTVMHVNNFSFCI